MPRMGVTFIKQAVSVPYMGLLESFLSKQTGDEGDFIELTEDNLKATEPATDLQVRLADIEGQRDMMAIKDALYSGDLVFASLQKVEINEMNEDRVTNELNAVVNEIGGDIVKDGSGNVILAPRGVAISREKLK